MTTRGLQAVREAARREAAHVVDGKRCYCDGCRSDREIMADAMPALLEYVRAAEAIPRRSIGDTWDLD